VTQWEKSYTYVTTRSTVINYYKRRKIHYFVMTTGMLRPPRCHYL